MHTRLSLPISAAFWLAVCAEPASAQQRTILAVGAHAADMDLTAGPILAHQKLRSDRIVILHLTLGEAGNPHLSPAQYAEQKRREASASANPAGRSRFAYVEAVNITNTRR